MIGIDLLMPNDQNNRFYGVAVGIVTNNKDPEKMGRVKVKFPWLSEEDESYWARIATPMAGGERGIYFLPEIDDEVLVIFEHGDVAFPYIIGALWNGKDRPPETNDDGKNNRRLIKSRSGHLIILDDTSGQEKIIVQDKTGKNKITIDSEKNSLHIEIEKDITIEAKGEIKIKSQENTSIECKNLIIKTKEDCQVETGKNFQLDAKADAKLKAQKDSQIEAKVNCSIKANAKGEFESQAGMDIKCPAGVKINNTGLEVI